MRLERLILERSGLVLVAVALLTVLAFLVIFDPVERRSRLVVDPSIWTPYGISRKRRRTPSYAALRMKTRNYTLI